MSEHEKGLGERLGEAVDAVQHKASEVAHRTRAEGHDFNAETASNPLDRAVEKGKGLAERAQAELHEQASEHDAKDATR